MDFSIKKLQRHIDDFYSKKIKERAQVYFSAGRVYDLEYDDDSFSGEVVGSSDYIYKVEFSYDDIKDRFQSYCDCAYEFHCKHEAALAYALIAVLGEKPIKKKKRNRLFSNLKSNEFRKIEVEGSLTSTIQSYSRSGNNQIYWGSNVVMTIMDDSHVEIYSTPYNYYYTKKIENHISLKLESQEIWVQCKSCNRRTSTFCNHQTAILNFVGEALEKAGFTHEEFSIPEAKKRTALSLNIDPDVFDKYYNLLLTMEGFEVEEKENVVGTNWLQEASYELNSQRRKHKEDVELEFSKYIEGRPPKYAYLWTDNDVGFPELKFMKGYGLKTKEGIHTASREVSWSPQIIPPSQREVAMRLKLLYVNSNIEESVDMATNLIAEHVDLLNEVYHYVLDQRYQKDVIANSELRRFTFDDSSLECRFTCEHMDGHIHVTRHLSLGGYPISYLIVSCQNLLFSVIGDRGYLHPNSIYRNLMLRFGVHDTLIFKYDMGGEGVRFIEQLRNYFDVEIKNVLLPKEVVLLNPEFQIYLEEIGSHVLIRPKIMYQDHQFEILTDEYVYEGEKKLKPDSGDVEFFRDFIRKAHPVFDKPVFFMEFVHLEANELINNFWFMRFVESCESLNITIFGQKDLKNYRYSTKKPVIATHVTSGIKWFDVSVDVSFGKEKVKNTDWIRAVKNNQTYVKLKDGSLGMLPDEWLKRIKKILKVSDVEKGDLAISKYRFNIIDELFTEDLDDALYLEIQEKKKRLIDYDFGKKYRIPTSVKANLRDYQKHGYQWLRFLENNEMGGILADDMGLGKTLQVICLLASQKKLGVSLVVVPRTLLYNWSAELDKFCPSLIYYVHHGQSRLTLIEDYKKPNVIISTYGTVASDIDRIKEYEFNYLILDESQAIKNPNSQRYKSIKLLKSRAVLAMTGTPIENNTMDLYAQFSVTSPGLLGSQSSFKKNFAVPIDNHGDTEAAALLRKMIYPFILRRTKAQVAKDLPTKSESVIYCEMGKTQRKLYEALREKIKEDVHSKVEADGLAQSKFFMLDGLLRLRQMCNSPLLVNSSFKGASAESAKIKVLIQNITENLESHSALVFSQFVSLLSIVRVELDKLKIPYAYLDGSTRNRKKVVQDYMENDNIQIFLISIKAGNTGMNLTKADYVYILDPWWNPAVEAQAIDRTHRIGQDKNVFAYKLICKDSIEEKILKLQDRKKELAKDIIQVDENVIKSLDKQRLLELFE